MKLKLKEMGRMWGLVVVLAVGLVACSKNEGDEKSSPGKITALGSTEFVTYQMAGEVRIPVNMDNKNGVIRPELFGIENYKESAVEEEGEDASERTIFSVKSVEKDEAGRPVLVGVFAYQGEKIEVSFELCYQETATRIPVSLTCYDALEVEKTHFCAGATGKVTFGFEENSWMPEGTVFDVTKYTFQALGGHKDEVSLRVNSENSSLEVALDENFELTDEEKEVGQAVVKVVMTDAAGVSMFFDFTVCQSYKMKEERVGADDSKVLIMVKDAMIELGIAPNASGHFDMNNRELTAYLAREGEVLVSTNEYRVFVGSAEVSENGKPTEPAISLRGFNKLEAGKYVLVAHFKKSQDENDHIFVDFCIPCVKE